MISLCRMNYFTCMIKPRKIFLKYNDTVDLDKVE